jgi:hypothetical protein
VSVRRSIYVLVFILIVAVLAYFQKGTNSFITSAPDPIQAEQIKKDFSDYRNNKQTGIDGEDIDLQFLFFPFDFTGVKDDAFYLGTEIDDRSVVLEYRIVPENEEKDDSSLIYELKNRWEGLQLPADRYETYRLNVDKWVIINPKK